MSLRTSASRALLAVCGALMAVPLAARAPATEARVHEGVQGLDCVSVVRNRWDTDLPVRFAALSPEERNLCLGQLLRVVSDPKPSVDPGPVAGGIEDLARKGLITDVSVFAPLIECLRVRDLFNGGYCNRAIEALTRHKYGNSMFAGTSSAPLRTPAARDEVAGDWLQLLRLVQPGRPIFDTDLKRICVDAMRAVGAKLSISVAPYLEQFNPVRSYLEAFSNAPSIPNGDGEVIFTFAIGEGEGFALPANWRRSVTLQGIRFLLFRPGIPNPSSVSRFDLTLAAADRPFPAEIADYREVFPALDLEFRYQVVTTSTELRSATVAALRDSLKGLREANAAYR